MASFIAIYLLVGIVIYGGMLIVGELLTDDEPTTALVRVVQAALFILFLPAWPLRLGLAIYHVVGETNRNPPHQDH